MCGRLQGGCLPPHVSQYCTVPAAACSTAIAFCGTPRCRAAPCVRQRCACRGLHLPGLLHAVQGSTLHAVAGYEDGSVALWDVRRPNQPLASAKLHSEAIMCVAVAPDCTSGFSGSADKHVSAFKLSIPRGQLRPSVQAALLEPGVADVAVRGDGRIVASAGWDGRVRVWHARKWLPLAVLRWHSQQVACVQFSADGRLLAAGGRDNHISIWSIYAEAP